MKLKKLLKYIDDNTYIKIGADGWCQCSCKKASAQDVIERYKDYKVSSIAGGRIIKSPEEDTFVYAVTIFLKDGGK